MISTRRITKAAIMTTISWLKSDSPHYSSSCWSHSFEIPNQSDIVSLTSSLGKNSRKARDFSSPMNMSALSGIFVYQVLMYTTNWSKAIIFHKYLNPNERIKLSKTLPMLKVLKVLLITSANSSSSSYSC